jgi:hypothetical protein
LCGRRRERLPQSARRFALSLHRDATVCEVGDRDFGYCRSRGSGSRQRSGGSARNRSTLYSLTYGRTLHFCRCSCCVTQENGVGLPNRLRKKRRLT